MHMQSAALALAQIKVPIADSASVMWTWPWTECQHECLRSRVGARTLMNGGPAPFSAAQNVPLWNTLFRLVARQGSPCYVLCTFLCICALWTPLQRHIHANIHPITYTNTKYTWVLEYINIASINIIISKQIEWFVDRQPYLCKIRVIHTEERICVSIVYLGECELKVQDRIRVKWWVYKLSIISSSKCLYSCLTSWDRNP